jgi:2-polyprenyl-3-methyl-5-hydroxy-6-metoxy-1,4-benzoquinol methylase
MNGFDLHRCTSCGFRFAPGAFDVEVDYHAVYRTTEYVETQVDPIGDPARRRAFAKLATYRGFFDNVRPGANGRLLDVGCGVGRFCHAAKDAGWDVMGIDVSGEAVDVGQRYATFPLLRASLDTLEDRHLGFDAVTAFEVLEHVKDPVGLLCAMRRRVGPGGQVYVTVPNWGCEAVRQTDRADWVPPVHLGFFTESALQRLAREAGFRHFETGVVETDPLPRTPAAAVSWMYRKMRGVKSEPLGLWLHASR